MGRGGHLHNLTPVIAAITSSPSQYVHPADPNSSKRGQQAEYQAALPVRQRDVSNKAYHQHTALPYSNNMVDLPLSNEEKARITLGHTPNHRLGCPRPTSNGRVMNEHGESTAWICFLAVPSPQKPSHQIMWICCHVNDAAVVTAHTMLLQALMHQMHSPNHPKSVKRGGVMLPLQVLVHQAGQQHQHHARLWRDKVLPHQKEAAAHLVCQ